MNHVEEPPAWAIEKARESVAEILRQDGFVDADISDVLSGIKDELHGIAIFARALAEADKAAAERERKTISDFAIKHPIEDEDVWESSEWHRGYGAARRCISNAAIRGAE